ncbi:MAG: MarR family winged helix-turn-helix transcriptional regulator [Actinomycetes bacterium]
MPPDPDAIGRLGEQMVRLTRASHAMRVQLAARGHDAVDWAAYALLFQLVTEGPQRTSALADTACVDPSTVSRQVGELVRAGLVERVPDPEDGRASLLVATARGRAVHTHKRERRQRLFSRVVDGWPVEDVAALTALLGRFNDSFAAARPALLDEHAADVPTLQETDR